ncbi:unnamed protein product [Angiostrongylus costaricensis]|uniref:DUF1758 domain-containing protein n=1 Tax=Angiostrongylus costaricensis TaxID=334426 RepID=A0A0R3PW34_ANGCS|nr:unnamed protein product [Angiostrongylus costaricensis]
MDCEQTVTSGNTAFPNTGPTEDGQNGTDKPYRVTNGTTVLPYSGTPEVITEAELADELRGILDKLIILENASLPENTEIEEMEDTVLNLTIGHLDTLDSLETSLSITPVSVEVTRTDLDLGEKSTVIKSRTVLRIQADAVVTKGAEVIGSLTTGGIEIKPQSLLTQELQGVTTDILKSVTDFLSDHGMSLTSEELGNVEEVVLIVVHSLTESVETTMTNPLWSDMNKNLNNEFEAFHSIFNALLEDANNCR